MMGNMGQGKSFGYAYRTRNEVSLISQSDRWTYCNLIDANYQSFYQLEGTEAEAMLMAKG
jgi:hypothetical protein